MLGAGTSTSELEVLIECGADLNARRQNGITPVHLFCMLAYTKHTVCLYDRHVNFDGLENSQGTQYSILSPLLGSFYKNLRSAEFVVQLLVKQGIVDGYQIIEVHLAEIENNLEELYANCKKELEFVTSIKVMNNITLYEGTNALKLLTSFKLPKVVGHHVLRFFNLIDLRNSSIT